jgi:hypothetical protein
MGPNKDINIQKNTVCAPVRVTPECSPWVKWKTSPIIDKNMFFCKLNIYIWVYTVCILSRFYGLWLRMVFGLVTGFIEHLQLVTTSNCSAIANSYSATHYSTHLSFLSLLCLHQFSGNSFQQQMFHLLWVPQLSPCLSYQLLTATAHLEWTAAVL